MTLADFRALTLDEFDAVMAAWRDRIDGERRERWEMVRTHAVMVMQPHCKKRLDPHRVLPFPWDCPDKPKAPRESKADARKAFLRRIGKTPKD